LEASVASEEGGALGEAPGEGAAIRWQTMVVISTQRMNRK